MTDLIDMMAVAPGKTDTSRDAAEKMSGKAIHLRYRCLALIKQHTDIPYYSGLTADECAGLMDEDILAVRPRLSELKDAGLIEKTDKRRPNAKGNSQIVWAYVQGVE